MKALPSGDNASRLGDFELVLELSSHETTVLLGRRTGPRRFSRWVALRYVGPFLGPDVVVADRVTEDARRSQPVSHPNVLGVLEVGVVGAGRFIATDYIEGGTLEDLLADGPIPAPILCAILIDVLAGLTALHDATDGRGRPLVLRHGRLSPKNIVIGLEGRAKIADLGLGRLTPRFEPGVLGSAHFRAPELSSTAHAPTIESDLFSAGMVLYVGLSGAHPAAKAPSLEALAARLSKPLPLLSANGAAAPELAAFVARAIAPDPQHRFRSADAMSRALEAIVRPATTREVGAFVTARRGAEIEARRGATRAWIEAHERALGITDGVTPWRRARYAWKRFARRNRTLSTALITLALIALGGLAGLVAWRIAL